MQPGDPTFFKTYFADNLAPTEEQLRGLTTEAGIKAFREGPILIDVASGNMRVRFDQFPVVNRLLKRGSFLDQGHIHHRGGQAGR